MGCFRQAQGKTTPVPASFCRKQPNQVCLVILHLVVFTDNKIDPKLEIIQQANVKIGV